MNRRAFFKGAIASELALLHGLSSRRAEAVETEPPKESAPLLFIHARHLTGAGHEYMGSWCERNGIRAQDTYCIGYDEQRGEATVFQYLRNAMGAHYYDPLIGGAARREPFTVPVKEAIGWRPEYGAHGM